MCHINTTKAKWKKEKENRHKRRRFRQPACVYPTLVICFVEVDLWQIGKTNSVSQRLGLLAIILLCWKHKHRKQNKSALTVGGGVCCSHMDFSWGTQTPLFTETESEAPHFISGFPISLSPFPEHLSHCQSAPTAAYFKHSVSPRPHLEHSLEKGRKRALLCSPPEFADGLHHEIRGLCGHHAAELSQQEIITPGQEGKGRRLRRVEVEEGQKRQEQCLLSKLFIYLFLMTHSQVLFFFLNPHHRVFGFVSLSRSSLFIVSVSGLKGSYLCKGINWARMRLNHKCKVASATARLYSLVAYQAISALPSIYAKPVWCFTSLDLPVAHTHKHRRPVEIVIWAWKS